MSHFIYMTGDFLWKNKMKRKNKIFLFKKISFSNKSTLKNFQI